MEYSRKDGGMVGNIESLTLDNDYFRRIVSTTKEAQLVVMALQPEEDIGREKHVGHSQFIRIEEGDGYAEIGKRSIRIEAGSVVFIPGGVFHNIVNTSKDETMKLYTIYSPPVHKANMKPQLQKSIHTLEEQESE
jgi:mannose-6-phosphate isomerase-like protein (cupin superfamily)